MYRVAAQGIGHVARVTRLHFKARKACPWSPGDGRAGKVTMQIVGLADKAVAESRERVQAALHASGLALPAK
jgi:magnesium chelatase family protein